MYVVLELHDSVGNLRQFNQHTRMNQHIPAPYVNQAVH